MTDNIFPAWNYTQSFFKWEKTRIFFENWKNAEFYSILWHNKDTFWWKKGLMDFLSKNTSTNIYINAGDPDLIFKEVTWWFLIWIEAFYEFQRNIAGSDAQKVDAFLKQKSNIHNSTYSEEEKIEFISSNTTEENISDIINLLSPEKQKSILSFLKTKLWEWWDFDFASNAEWVFLKIGNRENRDIVIEQLKKLEKNNFANIENALSISKINKVLEIWEQNKCNSHEVSFWQDFLKTNPWILSQVFPAPFAIFENEFYVWWHYSWNLSGSKNTDFWYKNPYSQNTAIIEIKTPTTVLVSNDLYWTRKGIYPMSQELIWAISQVLNQKDLLQKDFLQNNAAKDFKVWNPKIILIIWSEECRPLNNEQRACFELFKNSNKDIDILTFDELFEKIKNLKALYE